MARRRSVLVTGAGTGFGRGAAVGLSARGFRVFAAAEIWQQVNELASEEVRGRGTIDAIKLDLLSEVDLEHAASLDPDVLVLNAGIQESGSMVDIPLELVRRSFEVNVFAHLDLAQRIVPGMIKRKSGKVVWVSSLAGLVAPPFLGAYAATKHAIEAIASAMKAELNPCGIAVHTINPGLYRTGFNEGGALSRGQWDRSREVHVPAPPAKLMLALEHDPQPMIDAIVDLIGAHSGAYRTMLPKDAEIAAKAAQALAWKLKGR